VPYCSQCGERLSPNANFCPNCGVSLAQVPPIEGIQPGRKAKTVEGNYEAEEAVPEKTPEPTPYPEYVAPTMIPQPVATEHVPQPAKVRTSRSTANRIGALIFFAMGIAGICIGTFILLVALSIMIGAISDPDFIHVIPIVGQYLSGNVTTIALMILLMMLSAFHFVAGNWLYQSIKRGGIMGIIITAFDILISILGVILFPAIADFGYVVILLCALLMLLVIAGWNSLHSEIENIEG